MTNQTSHMKPPTHKVVLQQMSRLGTFSRNKILVKHKSSVTKTRLYSFDPLKPHFCIVKLGLTGLYIIFLTLLKIIDCGTR